MDRMTPEEKEYEALATLRDVALLLYSEISENTGGPCLRLRQAYENLTLLMTESGKGLMAR